MIVVEGTFWPLIVVGAIPEGDGSVDLPGAVDEERLWSTGALRLALVVAGTGSRARAAHDEVFGWLRRHHSTLRVRTCRVAWIVEDDTMRSSAENWLTLVEERLFGGETAYLSRLQARSLVAARRCASAQRGRGDR